MYIVHIFSTIGFKSLGSVTIPRSPQPNGLCTIDFSVFLDLLTVSETAHDVAFDEGNGINSPTNLGLEATFINQNFSQQCLKKGQDKKVFPNSNPFVTDEDEAQVASVAYR